MPEEFQFDVSEAIVLCLAKYPASNYDVFTEKYRDHLAEVRGAVKALINEFMSTDVDWKNHDLWSGTRYAASVVGRAHPELSADALTSLGNYYSYQMK